jgi:alcohol dehydrogenase class IV
MEYPVGAAVHCSHGAGNGLLLPYVMRYNMPTREEAFGYIAELLGDDTTGEYERGAAEAAIKAVEDLRRDIGIPTRLRDIGVKEEMLVPFAEKAFSFKRLMRVNPRYPTQAEIEQVFRAAF